jgi:hypothetical protein
MGQHDSAYGAAVAGTPSWSPADLLSFAIGAGWCSVATASLSAVVIDMLASGVAISRMMEGMGRARHDIASSIEGRSSHCGCRNGSNGKYAATEGRHGAPAVACSSPARLGTVSGRPLTTMTILRQECVVDVSELCSLCGESVVKV